MLLLKKNKYTFSKINNQSNALKLNGYYYSIIPGSNGSDLIDIVFLYNNGVLLYASTQSSKLSETETQFKNGDYYQLIKDSKNHWGPYKIEKDKLYFERWYPQESSAIRAFNCVILNDSTFELFETFKPVRAKQKLKQSLNQVYQFKKFSPKPDSTNKYVK